MLFQSVIRLQTKIRDKGKIHRQYQKVKAPYYWLMDDHNTPETTKQALVKGYKTLNPSLSKRQMNTKLQELAKAYQAKASKAVLKKQRLQWHF